MAKIKVRYNQDSIDQIAELMQQYQLNTVCREANCPNIGECYRRRTATFMILGNQCSRNCRFCNVTNGIPQLVDENEPERLAEAAKQMGLRHVVITSVTRDDLEDGGAGHFAETIRAVRKKVEGVTVEVLIPDFKGNRDALDKVIAAEPEIINHNLETVKSLYDRVRPEADYERSLSLLRYVKDKAPEILTKTGIMVGLGETEEEVYGLMDDAVRAGCDILTVGQYLQPSPEHYELKEYISDEQFRIYEEKGYEKGFRYVASGALVRSSYHAEEALKL